MPKRVRERPSSVMNGMVHSAGDLYVMLGIDESMSLEHRQLAMLAYIARHPIAYQRMPKHIRDELIEAGVWPCAEQREVVRRTMLTLLDNGRITFANDRKKRHLLYGELTKNVFDVPEYVAGELDDYGAEVLP